MTVMDKATATLQSDNDFLKLDFTKIPRLIGRSKERDILDEVFARLHNKNDATAEIIFVHGESGVGKSTLIEHLQEKIIKARMGGYFVSGKSDQLHNAARPYGAIVDAITDLSNQVEDNSKVLQAVQKDMFEILGNETSMLTNLIPALAALLEKPADNEDETSNDVQQQEQTLTQVPPNISPPAATAENNYNHAAADPKLPKRKPSRQNSLSSYSSHNSNMSKNNNSISKNETNGFSFRIFVRLFRTFLQTFCKPNRPLILFLDDLQWADDASCKLIKFISADTTIENFLLVGAYRDNDEAKFDFDYHVCKLKVSDMLIGPLSHDHISKLIAIVTCTVQQEDETEGLAQVVLDKTGGNIFFAIQYLEALYRQRLLYYDIAATKWTWNVDQIKRNTTVSDNIVDLLIGKIQSLRKEMQSILMFASCLGFTFDTEVLLEILISEKIIVHTTTTTNTTSQLSKYGTISYSQFAPLLFELSQQGLVQPFNERKYQFSHDRIQQSAHTLLPKGKEGDQLHLRIGEIILEYSKGPFSESWMVFRAVDLLSQQSDYVTSNSKKMELVQLNIHAANEAVVQMSFLSACRYVKQAIALLNPKTMWNENYELCLELFTMHAKMQHACGEFEKCLEIVDIILQNAKSLEDKLPAYYQRVLLNTHKIDLVDALTENRMILEELGIRIPPKGSIFRILTAILKTKRLLKGRSAMDLLSLPTMTDVKKIMAMKFLAKFSIICYEIDDNANMLDACMKMARMSIKHGMCQQSLFALSSYGFIIAAMGNVKEGQEYAKLIYKLLERPGLESGSAYCVPYTCSFLDHLKTPIQETLPKLLECYRTGMEQGNVENSTIALITHTVATTLIGTRMDNLERQLHSYCELCREFGQESRLKYILPYYQFAINMAGKSDNPLILTENVVSEVEMEKSIAGHLMIKKYFHFVRMISRYIFGDYDGADCDRQIVDKADKKNTASVHYFLVLYCGLICFAMAKKYPKKKKKYQRLAQRYIQEIKNYVDFGSVNGPPMLQLLLAEQSSLSGSGGKTAAVAKTVKDAYDTAIRFNRRSGFRILTCISMERAGEYYYNVIGDENVAKDYLQGAYIEYEDLCAFGKSAMLREKYSFLLLLLQQENDESKMSSSLKFQQSNSVSSKFVGNIVPSLQDNDLNHQKKLGLYSGGDK